MIGVEPGISHKEIEEYPEEYYNPVEGLQKQLDFKEMVTALSNHSVSQWIDNYLSFESVNICMYAYIYIYRFKHVYM